MLSRSRWQVIAVTAFAWRWSEVQAPELWCIAPVVTTEDVFAVLWQEIQEEV